MVATSILWLYVILLTLCKQMTVYEMRISDWSSDVCSSDLLLARLFPRLGYRRAAGRDHPVARGSDHPSEREARQGARPRRAADHHLGAARAAVHAPDRQV